MVHTPIRGDGSGTSPIGSGGQSSGLFRRSGWRRIDQIKAGQIKALAVSYRGAASRGARRAGDERISARLRSGVLGRDGCAASGAIEVIRAAEQGECNAALAYRKGLVGREFAGALVSRCFRLSLQRFRKFIGDEPRSGASRAGLGCAGGVNGDRARGW